MKCPNCGCPFLRTSGCRTAYYHTPWQDTDGTWYNGPAKEDLEIVCEPCGWKEIIVKKDGKLVSEDETWPSQRESGSSMV